MLVSVFILLFHRFEQSFTSPDFWLSSFGRFLLPLMLVSSPLPQNFPLFPLQSHHGAQNLVHQLSGVENIKQRTENYQAELFL